jgi:predicted PurR-regulated permease PerM
LKASVRKGCAIPIDRSDIRPRSNCIRFEDSEMARREDITHPEDKIETQSGSRPNASQTGEKTLLGLLLIGIFYTLYFARAIIVPVLLALFLTAILRPIVHHMHRLRVPESLGAAVAVVFLAGLLVAGVYELSDPAAKWLDQGPIVLTQLKYKLYPLQKTIKDAQKTSDKITEMTDVQKKEEKVVVKGPSLARQVFGYAKSSTLTALIVLFLLYFLLGFGGSSIRRISPDPTLTCQGPRWIAYIDDIGSQISVYIRTLSLINLGLGMATVILMAILGMPNPILWGVLAALFNFIPYLGAMVMTGIIGIVSFVTFESWNEILLPPLLFLCLTGLEGLVVQTLAMGKQFRLNPVIVFISFLIWGWLWGPVGALFAVSITGKTTRREVKKKLEPCVRDGRRTGLVHIGI